jgi:microcystin-dependent protein
MTYQVNYTETTNPAKTPITVADQTLNSQTSLTFVGKNYAGYAPILATDLLHLLENFASPMNASGTGPANATLTNPVQGQLWYDNTNNLLKVYDGTTWNAAGSIKKATTAPLVANSSAGDLWVNTVSSQLYLFSGSNWLLVGPQFSQGTLTGPNVETIIDTSNISHNVVSLYSNNYRIAIISKDSFTPKSTIAGFTTGISEGINLSSVNSTSSTNPTRFHGTATSADSLLIGNTEVSGSNFLRGDALSIGNFPLNIRSDGGITVGSNLSFNIGTDGNSTIMYNKLSGSAINFKLINGTTTSTVLYLDPTTKVGIGANNTSPVSTLDVMGGVTIKDDSTNNVNGQLSVNGTADVGATGGASIKTTGGLTVAKQTLLGDDATFNGQIFLNYTDSNGNPIAKTLIEPASDAAAGLYDIGTAIRPFRNIYANAFVGTFNGNFTGSLTGSISGSAAKLSSPTVFSLIGDVTSNALAFDGQTETGTAVFTTSINQGIITSKDPATDSLPDDTLLIYRGTSAKLLQMTKTTLLQHVPTVPVGAIFPFAGAGVPTGYLLCDGSEVQIATYGALYSVILYAYKDISLLKGQATFALPDLRGRFPLGKDDMNNGLEVPAKDGSGTNISAGGGTPVPDRVVDVTARTLGGSAGIQSITVSQQNLPDHQHTLSDSSGAYYALPGSQTVGASDTNASANIQVATGTSTAYGLGRTGSVTGVSQLGTSINNMNPYQTINYIIFTGVL